MKLPYLPNDYSKKEHVILLTILLLLTFTSFILTIISTTGSTSNYVPLTNIYLGTADITHINVTKVVPQIGPILLILGTALTAPNRTLDNIFDALKTISETPALTPLMYLLSNAQNVSQSVLSLTQLAPLAISGNPATDTKDLVEISGLLKISNNQSQTLDGLKNLVVPMLTSSTNNSKEDHTTELTLELLADSKDPTLVANSLSVLNGLTMSEKMKMLPIFTLFSETNNITELVNSLGTIMETADNVSPARSQLVLTTLQTMLASNPNVTTAFSTISSLASGDDEKAAIGAIKNILEESTDVNNTLTTLNNLIKSNITQSESSKDSMVALSSIINNVSNQSKAISTISQLAANTDTVSTTAQLEALLEMLDATDQGPDTIEILASLQTSLNPNSTTFKYIPSLFTLLDASANPPVSFSSLVTLTAWAQQNPETFIPIVAILDDALKVEMVSEEQLKEMTPILLEYLEIPVYFQLSIFTLCTRNLNHDILECSASHAVQNLDFRQIIYDALSKSEFAPYLNALDIGPNELYLEGDLLEREHEYVPSIKAVLSMNILAIIFSFITMVTIAFLFWIKWSSKSYAWVIVIFLAAATALFLGLSCTVLTVVLQVIKSGTYKDNFGVVFTAGPSYNAMMWCAFSFMVISGFILLVIGLYERHLRIPYLMKKQKEQDVEVESSVSEVDSGIQEPKPEIAPGQVVRHSSENSSDFLNNDADEKQDPVPDIQQTNTSGTDSL
ncbi:similar to Saccharomyces cerevisiae YLR413W Putative protein of unknown function [Maudiozyma saulgeensis]|uniref:Uncharacterized protein n=1 Tax=Maudiozyma saulgeensis TaxID=1789683 RepID=A0A1X7QZ44_9SACH|nr:similar to Saccharomyces cerevisiae YLR413W Putative protein of unknown function [Kazachstania saulgeensis]